MAAWSAGSNIFRQYVADVLDNTTALDIGTDTMKAALYNNTTAPDFDVTAANSAYAVGQWVVGNEMDDVGQWATGGQTIASPAIDVTTTGIIKYDTATDTASSAGATLSTVFGCLVYSNVATPVANQGVCFNYFGGTQGVTNGVFTIVWHASGIFQISVV